jgi:OmpA-OmpF porin, OOP family
MKFSSFISQCSIMLLLLQAATVFSAFAQDDKIAQLKLILVDTSGKALANEKIEIKSSDNTFDYTSVSNDSGIVFAQLEKGKQFKMYCRNSASEKDFTELDIPKEEGPLEIEYILTLEPPVIFDIHNIYFQANDASVSEQAKTELIEVVDWLKRDPSIELEIIGFTDSIEFLNAEQQIDKRRATTVQQFFIDKGIEVKRVPINARGKIPQITFNRTETERQKNRRIEFKIIKN